MLTLYSTALNVASTSINVASTAQFWYSTMDRNDTQTGFYDLELDAINSDFSDINGKNDDCNVTINVDTDPINVDNPQFPLSKRQAGKILGVSDMSVKRWGESLESVGVKIFELSGKISRNGFTQLQAVKTATGEGLKLSDYLATIKPVTVETVETDPLTDGIFSQSSNLSIVHSGLNRLSEITSLSLAQQAQLSQQLNDLFCEVETDKNFKDELRIMRQTKVKETVLSEFLEDEKLRKSLKRQLQLQLLQSELDDD